MDLRASPRQELEYDTDLDYDDVRTRWPSAVISGLRSRMYARLLYRGFILIFNLGSYSSRPFLY